MAWAALVGRGRAGKAAAVVAIAARLKAHGVRVDGFHSLRVGDGYQLERVLDGARIPSAAPTKSADPDVCDFMFDEAVFETARDWILGPNARWDLAVLEVGKVEASGKAHWPTVVEALERGPCLLLLRPDYLSHVALSLEDPFDFCELPADSEALLAFADRLKGAI